MIKPKILYVAPLKDFSGYAHCSRDYVRALDSVGCNIVTRHLKYDSGSYNNSSREEELASRDLQDVDIVLAHTTPNESCRKKDVFSVIYFAWETDRLPKEWVDKINAMDLALVPCQENVKAARLSGVVIPIEKIVHTFDLSKYSKTYKPFVMPNANETFKMLCICQFSKKKGIDTLLKAYLSEFGVDEKVLLMLKMYISAGKMDSEQEKAHIIQTVNQTKGILRLDSYPKIHLVHGIMPEEDICRLYTTADSYVMPSRGEGFSITHFDAMGFGKPPIAVNWGGPVEFITEKEGWLVDYDLSPVVDMNHPFKYLYTAKENWAEPHIGSLRKSMREAYQAWSIDKAASGDSVWSDKVKACKNKVKAFTYDKIGTGMRDVIYKYYKEWKESKCSLIS